MGLRCESIRTTRTSCGDPFTSPGISFEAFRLAFRRLGESVADLSERSEWKSGLGVHRIRLSKLSEAEESDVWGVTETTEKKKINQG